MSVPTSNLYDFVHQVLENKFLIKYFYPWGHKELHNLINNVNTDLTNYAQISSFLFQEPHPSFFAPTVVCHDQEPLDFDLYLDNEENLRACQIESKRDRWILLHSELNSDQVKKYKSTGKFECAYWWSHAAIARDWYRFAEYDQRLLESHKKVANWLVYARDTTGKREYRERFLDILRVVSSVQLGSINTDVVVTSDSSAEYNHEDYTKTNCSIVLQTVFDNRIHLTEKTLRPIACGHPFMILSGPGTLKYLRTYGFKTFHPFIDESYDLETDSDKRMTMVISEMDRINKLPQADQEHIWKSCAVLARHNKELFFSDEFFDLLTTELKNNIDQLPSSKIDISRIRLMLTTKTKQAKLAMPQSKRLATIKLYLHLRNGGSVENFVI